MKTKVVAILKPSELAFSVAVALGRYPTFWVVVRGQDGIIHLRPVRMPT